MDEDQAAAQYSALGEMVSRVRELEHEAYTIARALGVVGPETQNVSPVLREARRQLRQGLPPWSRNLTPEEVESWIDSAFRVFDYRNQEVHWTSYHRFEGGSWVPYRGSLRGSGEIPARSIDALKDLSRRAVAASKAGSRIWQRLIFEIRPGVFHWHPALARSGEEWIPLVVEIDGRYPARPTGDELAGWYENLRRRSPPEWQSWPMERYREQTERKARARQDRTTP